MAACGLALLGLESLARATRPPGWFGVVPREQLVNYVLLGFAAGAVYAGAIVLARGPHIRRALPMVLAVAALLRLAVLVEPPLLSTDLYRYVWDGRVQAAWINPYRYMPADPALAALRDGGADADAIFPNINRADTARTIYPPAAQGLFALLGVTWSSIWAVKTAMLAFDAIAIAAALMLLRAAAAPAQLVLIYAWNPLPVWEFAGAGHIDAAAVAFTGLAMLAAVWRRPGWAGAAIGIAVLFKLLPAALFPALWRRWDWRAPVAAAAAILAGYACYASAGPLVLGYLGGYANEEGVGGHGALLLRLWAAVAPVPGWAGPGYAGLALAGLLALAAAVALRGPFPADPAPRARLVCRTTLALGTASMVALSPHYPWYLAGLALPAVLAPAPSVLWLTIAAPVLYLDDWHDKVIWPSLLFLPFFALLALELLRGDHVWGLRPEEA